MRAALFLLTLAAFAQAPDFDALVVEDSTGNPLASAEVRFRRIGQRELAADLDTGRDGRIRASGLPPGDYSIDISKPNFVTASLKIKLPASGLTVRLVRYASISGLVSDSQGKPALGRVSAPYGRTLGGARITILIKTDAGFKIAREAEIDDDGRYRFHDLRPGDYTVALWYDRLKDGSGLMMYPDAARPRIFTVAGGEEYRDVNFQLVERPAFSVSGKVQLPKPKTKFSLSLGLPDQPLIPIAQALTEEDGSFQFDRVPAGTYDLFVAGPDRGYGMRGYSALDAEPVFARTRVSVTAGNIAGLDLSPAAGHNLAVKLAGDRPPSGCAATITVLPELVEPWSAMLSGKATQVAFGKEQTIPHLPPGLVRLTVSDLSAGCYLLTQPVADLRGGAATVTLQLASAGSIRGALRGSPRPSDFTIVLIEADPPPDSQARLATPDPDGKFTFETVPPGRYRIAARRAAGDPRSRWVADLSRMVEIQIAGGGPTDIELPAPQGDRQ